MEKGKRANRRFVTLFHQSRWGKVLPIMMSSGQIRHSYGNLFGRQMMDSDETRLACFESQTSPDQQPLSALKSMTQSQNGKRKTG